MQPAPVGREGVPLARHAREVAELREWVAPQLAAHAALIAETLERGPRAAFPEELRNRDRDVWSPLFALAEAIGGSWPQECLAAYKILYSPRKDEVTPVRDALDALQAFQEARKASYDAVANGAPPHRSVRFGDQDQARGAEYDALIPLGKVPIRLFREWLSTPAGGQFAIATASPGEGPLSETKIYQLLEEAEVYHRRFTKMKDGKRIFIQVFDLQDLERAWAEQRGE